MSEHLKTFELETAFELAMEYAQDPERWRDPAKSAAWLLSVEARKLQDKLDQALVDVQLDVFRELESERVRHRLTETQLAEARRAVRVHSINEGKLHAQIAELETSKHGFTVVLQSVIELCQKHGWVDGEAKLLDWLGSRLVASASSGDTLEHIEVVCALLGYEPEAGQPVTEWIEAHVRAPQELPR